MTTRIRDSFRWRCSALIRISGGLRCCGRGVDLGEHALRAVVVGLQAGFLGLASGAEAVEERLGGRGGIGLGGLVAGMMGRLRAAGRVAHPSQGPARGGSAGEFEA